MLLEWAWQDRMDAYRSQHRDVMDNGVEHGLAYYLPKERREYAEDPSRWVEYATEQAAVYGGEALKAMRHGDAGWARMWAAIAVWFAHRAGIGRDDDE